MCSFGRKNSAVSTGASLLEASTLPYLVRGGGTCRYLIMSRARKPRPTIRSRQGVVARRDDPCSEEIRSVRADVQLLLEISKRKKVLETTKPRTASVTPTLNLVLARARDIVRTLTAQLQNNTGENIQIRMYVVSISHSLGLDVSSTIMQALCHHR